MAVWLLLARPLLGTWPTTQACALDWESNQQPFGLQAGTQSTEPHQPGLFSGIFYKPYILKANTEIYNVVIFKYFEFIEFFIV